MRPLGGRSQRRARQFATQPASNSVSNVPSQLEQRPGRTGARSTVSDRPHITQYRRTVVRTAWRSAARCSAGASSTSSTSRCLSFLRPTLRAFSIIMADSDPRVPESAWLERHDSDGSGPVSTKFALQSAGTSQQRHSSTALRGPLATGRGTGQACSAAPDAVSAGSCPRSPPAGAR
jgi:hypothetical protein